MKTGLVLTASPEFTNVAVEEVRTRSEGVGEITVLGDGVFFWEHPDASLANHLLLSDTPIFLHHMHTATVLDYTDMETLHRSINEHLQEDLLGAPVGCSVAVQGRWINSSQSGQGRQLKAALDGRLLQLGFLPAIKDPKWIISVTVSENNAYYGVSPAAWNLTDWSGGKIHFRKSAEDISRSKFKLLEAITRWQLRFAPGGLALDLGAAPGGWTSVLLERGMKVISVDTGLLDHRLRGYPGLTFLQQNVRQLTLPQSIQLDLITCDMSWDPFFTVSAINRLVPHLSVGGHVILTVKLMGKRPLHTVREVCAKLDEALQVVHAQHLFHNRQEITLHLAKS
ncbi:MAG: SAM-dependent methyltransferase [Bacillota bacterium]|jgi:23S rRNA (cytidine2498-2'-O)-methyltransferase